MVRVRDGKSKKGVFIVKALQLIQDICSLEYCVTTHCAQIEPNLIDLTTLVLEDPSYALYLDEFLECLVPFLIQTHAMTDITYRVYDKVPQLLPHLTINGVFRFYFVMMTDGIKVLLSRPDWVD